MSIDSENDIVVKGVSDLIELTIGAIRDRARAVVPPDELFHFTDAHGTIGILGDGLLWASLSTALNDASEERYTLDFAIDLVRSGRVGTGYFFDELIKYLVDPTQLPLFAIKAHAFVVSLCNDADSAPQWLHYGRQGTGIALCFDGKELAKTKDCDLVPILYDPTAQEAFLASLISKTVSRVARDTRTLPEPHATVLTKAAAHLLAQSIRIIVAAHLKAPAFRHENEWRLVTLEFDRTQLPAHLQSKVSTIHYRSRNQRVVPFLKIPLATPPPVSSIVLGHSNPMEDAEPALRVLWGDKVKTTASIRRSKVTVRP